MLETLEHQEINVQVEVTWIMLRTITQSLLSHARVLEANIHFALVYTADHIFLVLTIKDLKNKNGDLTTPFKLATGPKPTISHLRVLFCPCVFLKDTAHVGKK